MSRLASGIALGDRYVRSFPIVLIGDMPQQSDNAGFMRHNAAQGCRACTTNHDERADPNFNVTTHGRCRCRQWFRCQLTFRCRYGSLDRLRHVGASLFSRYDTTSISFTNSVTKGLGSRWATEMTGWIFQLGGMSSRYARFPIRSSTRVPVCRESATGKQ
jgi:hypothetical protein